MWDRNGTESGRRPGRLGDREAGRPAAGKVRVRPAFEPLEGRALLAASLAPIANVSVPPFLGYQVPLNGSASGVSSQTFTVTSDNPDVAATVAKGQFLTLGIAHTSSNPTGTSDPAFTGTEVFQLFDDLVPLGTSRIEQLVNQGWYTTPTLQPVSVAYPASNFPLSTKNFHRVASGFPGPSDFIVQGGSPNGNGTGTVTEQTSASPTNQTPDPNFPFVDEFKQQLAYTGTGQLAFANTTSDTNSSQFFITTGSPRFLDNKNGIFGQLVSGASTLQQTTQVALGTSGTGSTTATTPGNPIEITSATLSTTNPNGVIHVDTTKAHVGDVAHVTVTATDPSTGTTSAQTFTVNVVADTQTTPVRPFLNPTPNQTAAAGQTVIFQLSATAPTPNDPLTYVVEGGLTTDSSGNAAFSPVPSTVTATADANGVVTIKPTSSTFTGTVNLLVGVLDATNRSGSSTLQVPSNVDTNAITVTFQNGAMVLLRPIAGPVTQSVASSGPTSIQLLGNSANPGNTAAVLTYNVVSQPRNGTLTSLNAATGTVVYTPNANSSGTDSFSYTTTVTANGTSLTSSPATVTLTVAGTQVRQVQRVLIVTPNPRTDKGTNVINVDQVNGNIEVGINGVIAALQPAVSSLDQVIVYGSKANDRIIVGPEVTLPATLDGGHGGVNSLKAGDVISRLHGWFGKNTLQGGAGNDTLIGRQGHVKFVKSGGNDVIFAGVPHQHFITGQIPNHRFGSNRHNMPPSRTRYPGLAAPGGTFYKFVGNKLVAIPTPRPSVDQKRGNAAGFRTDVPNQAN